MRREGYLWQRISWRRGRRGRLRRGWKLTEDSYARGTKISILHIYIYSYISFVYVFISLCFFVYFVYVFIFFDGWKISRLLTAAREYDTRRGWARWAALMGYAPLPLLLLSSPLSPSHNSFRSPLPRMSFVGERERRDQSIFSLPDRRFEGRVKEHPIWT